MCQKGISISAKNPPPPPHHCQKREYQAAVAEVIGNFATLCVEIQRSELIKEERNKTRMEERKKQDKSQESIKKTCCYLVTLPSVLVFSFPFCYYILTTALIGFPKSLVDSIS